MDLYAYSQIPSLSEVAEANGIVIPRLRGYRLMSEEEKYSDEDIKKEVEWAAIQAYKNGCRSEPRFRPNDAEYYEYSLKTDKIIKKYTVCDESGDTIGFRWDLIHGKNRRAMKLGVKQSKRQARKQLETFNKYVGRDDVLFVHARLGGWRWDDFGGSELARQPWFLEKMDDYMDSTYCDIYCKIHIDKGD